MPCRNCFLLSSSAATYMQHNPIVRSTLMLQNLMFVGAYTQGRVMRAQRVPLDFLHLCFFNSVSSFYFPLHFSFFFFFGNALNLSSNQFKSREHMFWSTRILKLLVQLISTQIYKSKGLTSYSRRIMPPH